MTEERKGLGEDGKTLRQMLEESEQIYKKTGFYGGITDLQLRHQDPLKYELFHSRIVAALISGRETTKMISGSPFVREVAELCIGLYTPEGDNIAQSTGIQLHIQCMGDLIKWMINKNYEEDVGIAEGDLFCSNDNAICGVHMADVYDLLPIFQDGELLGWVCTVIMEPDVGGVTPSCMPMANVERASDGVKICAEKVGSNDQLRRDFEIRIEQTMGMPQLFTLDRKGAIAANIRVRKEALKMIDEFGLDYYKRASRELIEEERRAQLGRIRERTIPGRYRNVSPLEFYMKDQPVSWLPAKRDVIRLAPIEMEILASGEMVLDFEGAGEWGWHSMNSTPSGMSGGLSIGLIHTMCYDGRANLGSILPCHLKLPVDSVFNPSNIRELPTSNGWAPICQVFGLWFELISQAYYARGFREEVFSLSTNGGGIPGGYDQYGVKRALMNASGAGILGAGARGVADGLDNGGVLFTPEVDMGNFEVWEMFVPYLDLGRIHDPYTVGYGRFRSGASIAAMWLHHNSREAVIGGCGANTSDAILPNRGLFGGYPPGRQQFFLIRNPKINELVAKRESLVHAMGDPDRPDFHRLEGEVIRMSMTSPVLEINDGDLMICAPMASGGLGDPVERDTRRVKEDLDNGLATPRIARDIYCVEAQYDDSGKEWAVDSGKTDELRQKKREQRLTQGVPTRQWWQQARERVMAKGMNGMLIEMYQNSMKMSNRFTQEFNDFWALPENFEM
jgi:N-methylhydantoinase B/oxoprolinase/acetone carboxylase alpha subunit